MNYMASPLRKTFEWKIWLKRSVIARNLSDKLIGRVENQIDKLELSISQADLASWLGVRYGRLNSTLKKFQTMGLIESQQPLTTIADFTSANLRSDFKRAAMTIKSISNILSKNEAANERIKTILVVDADKK
jgi:hypothetical protein